MPRVRSMSPTSSMPALLVVAALAAAGCSSASGKVADAAPSAVVIPVQTATVVSEPTTRTVRMTGSLLADEQAEVSAEVNGRVVGTPVELGMRVAAGAPLVVISREQASAAMAEAQANAAQSAAALGIVNGSGFDPERVPDVANAKAEWQLADADHARIKSLLDQKVVSQSEYDQRRTRVEAARQQYEASKNAAQQRYQALAAANARIALAQKALNDTTVRAPFTGIVAERRVSVGDFVTTGTKVVTVVRTNPLRLALTVPEQLVSKITAGQPVRITVDAYPDRVFTGTVRYIAPSLRSEQRSLTVEAIVPNPDDELKPGFFASADVAQEARTPALLVPQNAVRTTTGTHRVFVITGDRVEERIVRTGQVVGNRVEIVEGVAEGDIVAIPTDARLTDGSRVSTGAASPPSAR
jgi:multidrug efflux pump subunit AcrA (membrane-fusion protein)